MNHQDLNQLRSLVVLVGGGLCAGKVSITGLKGGNGL